MEQAISWLAVHLWLGTTAHQDASTIQLLSQPFLGHESRTESSRAILRSSVSRVLSAIAPNGQFEDILLLAHVSYFAALD
ncbi:hypothetical protein GGR54DRAFT_643435 [Hypoxylon sp. NC1633]|nr:hypothetical protein GGR54DRAFT_643435 [Hypoxylon sp. NC1633]